MNFLAHSLLGFNNTELIAGQFCGDFVRGSELSGFAPGIERGIRLHRYLDVFTDSFPALQPVRRNMHQVPRRFAGIVIDVLFDHYLATHWDAINEQSLESHAAHVHAALHKHREVLPDALRRFMIALQEHNILVANRDIAAIEHTLARLAKRSPRFGALAISQADLLPLREQLREPFDSFYPELREAAVTYLDTHPVQERASE